MTQPYEGSEGAIAAAAKLSPAWGVTGVTLAGIHVQDWVLLATLVYTVVMIAERLWKWHRDWKRDRDDDE